jgi:hypothetical protein
MLDGLLATAEAEEDSGVVVAAVSMVVAVSMVQRRRG